MSTPKPVRVTILPDTDPAYRLLRTAVELADSKGYRPGISDVRIAIVMRSGWKADRDGRLVLGKAHKMSDLEKECHVIADEGAEPPDAAILVNAEAYPELTERQKVALFFHEVLHFAVVHDDAGGPKQDERGRTVLRYVKHSIEEHVEVVEEFGLYKSDLVAFSEKCLAAKDNPLFGGEFPKVADVG